MIMWWWRSYVVLSCMIIPKIRGVVVVWALAGWLVRRCGLICRVGGRVEGWKGGRVEGYRVYVWCGYGYGYGVDKWQPRRVVVVGRRWMERMRESSREREWETEWERVNVGESESGWEWEWVNGYVGVCEWGRTRRLERDGKRVKEKERMAESE